MRVMSHGRNFFFVQLVSQRKRQTQIYSNNTHERDDITLTTDSIFAPSAAKQYNTASPPTAKRYLPLGETVQHATSLSDVMV